MNIYEISWPALGLGYILLIIPFALLYLFRTGLVKETLIAVIRMTIQLFLVGVYLEVLFRLNKPWINIAWVLIMILVASAATTRRSELKPRLFFLPVTLAILFSMILIDAFFLGLVIRPENFFEARYFIPITGMIIGNCMERNIIALNSFRGQIYRELSTYRYFIANGASRHEALLPFIRNALKSAFNPLIANMAVIGLIALPGTMTGQILGGSSPNQAIRYQILLMLGIFIATMMTVVLTILLSRKMLFDEMDNLKEEHLVRKT
ncbi:MAG: ABC transporter permease [Bacteroidales bacterium]|jgi:putative ABC transport system permease protein|nr:ABC transporter permease [Bacteroidales bacterium]NLM91825.1 ABC transporter permease [Bacteroidales bacterium]